jgi:hypothetical protein
VAMYALARQFGMDRLWAAIAAHCSAWFFPNFSSFSGIPIIYSVNPTAAITVSLFLVLMTLLVRVTSDSTVTDIARFGLAATAVVGLIVYNDPMTIGLVSFCIAACFLTAVFVSDDWFRTSLRRLAVLAIPAFILLAAGIAQYVLALDYYTYRVFFRTELPKTQIPVLASMLFASKAGSVTLAISLIGLVLGCIFTRGGPLAAVLVGLTAMIVSSVSGLIYLFGDFQWWFPLPMYVEFYSFPFVMIGAVAGYAGFRRVLPIVRLRTRPLRLAVQICCLMTMPAVLVYGASRLPPTVTSEPFVDRALVSDEFARDLGISAGSEWKGSVYIVFRNRRENLEYLTLWDMRIPTHNEYSQTSTPLWYYMTFKVMHTNESKGPLFQSSSIPHGKWNIGLAAAFGIRYVMLPAEAKVAEAVGADPQAREEIADHFLNEYRIPRKIPLKRIAAANGEGFTPFSWLVYELPDPNHGQYSPTAVQLANSEAEYQLLFSQPGFDWRRDVVLERSPGPLTPASGGRLYVERGHLRVEASNGSGRSLVLLPVQYSNCLRVSGSGDPQLVRANMYFAGLLFSGDSKARVDYDFGFLNSRCRLTDVADLKRLKIPETAEPASPALHPFVIRRLSDIPLRLRQLRDLYRALRPWSQASLTGQSISWNVSWGTGKSFSSTMGALMARGPSPMNMRAASRICASCTTKEI